MLNVVGRIGIIAQFYSSTKLYVKGSFNTI